MPSRVTLQSIQEALERAAAAREPGTVLNLTGLDQMPSIRDQFRLDRYEPPRGMPKSLDGAPVLGRKNANRLKRFAEQGVERGGAAWYNTEPLYQEFVKELGVDGQVKFDRYMDLVAATSPRSTVQQNIKRASYLYMLENQGLPISGLENADFPRGYGHLAHKTQDHLLADLEGGQHFEALSRPKTSSFAENLKGNFEPMTIDTHNRAVVFDDPSMKKSPTGTEYLYLEDFQRKLANEIGLSPAQWQSAVWMGADDITGVSDSRPFLEVFDEAVVRTAALQEKSKSEVLSDFIRGKAPLSSIMLAAGVGSIATSEEAEAAGIFPVVKNIGADALRTGITRVQNPEDVAHIVASIRKSPHEQLMGVVTDDAGNVLDVVRHTVGTKNSSLVDGGVFAGSVLDVPGAKRVYMAHNHPSGGANQSNADFSVNAQMKDIFDGTGVDYQGSVVVTPGGNSVESTWVTPDGKHRYIDTRPEARRTTVPTSRREFRSFGGKDEDKHPYLAASISGPKESKYAVAAASGGDQGILFLDNRNKPVGWMSMSPEDMVSLRGTGNQDEILRQIHRSNASAAIIHGEADRARNVVGLLERSNIRALDVVEDVSQPTLGERGIEPTGFISRTNGQLTWNTAAPLAATGALGAYAAMRPTPLQAAVIPSEGELSEALDKFRKQRLAKDGFWEGLGKGVVNSIPEMIGGITRDFMTASGIGHGEAAGGVVTDALSGMKLPVSEAGEAAQEQMLEEAGRYILDFMENTPVGRAGTSAYKAAKPYYDQLPEQYKAILNLL